MHWVALHGTDPITAYVNTLWVELDQRRQGVGTALKDAGEAWARNKKATRIMSTVAIANPSMIEFKKARGFAIDSVDMVKSPCRPQAPSSHPSYASALRGVCPVVSDEQRGEDAR